MTKRQRGVEEKVRQSKSHFTTCAPAGEGPSGQSERLAGAGEGSAGAEKNPFSAIFTMQRSPLASLLAFRTS